MDLFHRLNNDLPPEFDYLKLVDILRDYASPRDQITKLIRSQSIVRVKKGIYVLGPDFRKPYVREILANMIYGPSYVSGVSALSFYQLIPERTESVSSRTPNRHKSFDTPVGHFNYEYLDIAQYPYSIEKIQLDTHRSFLIASREKAIVEQISTVKAIQSSSDLLDWIHSMRIDVEIIPKLRLGELALLQKVFCTPQISYLVEVVRKEKQ